MIDSVTTKCRCGAEITMKLGKKFGRAIGWTFVSLRMQEAPTVAKTPVGEIETGDLAKLGYWAFCPECGVDVWKFFEKK